MLRNDLIDLLGEQDSENIAVKIGDVLIDVDGAIHEGGNVVLVLAPGKFSEALTRAVRSSKPGGKSSRIVAASHVGRGLQVRGEETIMLAREVRNVLRINPDADVTVAIGATLVDIFAVSYDSRKEKFVLRILDEDLVDVLSTMAGTDF